MFPSNSVCRFIRLHQNTPATDKQNRENRGLDLCVYDIANKVKLNQPTLYCQPKSK